jgi:chemotaxis protein CheD
MTKEIMVTAGKYYIASNPTKLCCIGLGSCVAVTLYDRTRRIGGLAHAMLPSYISGIDRRNPGKYVDTSIYLMVDELIAMDTSKKVLKAKIVGGAQMFNFITPGTMDIGEQNIQVAKKILKEEGIILAKENVRGQKGRTIAFDLCTGLINVKTSGEDAIDI